MSQETLTVGREGYIATLTLNRPDRLNALDLAQWRRLAAEMTALAQDQTLRAVVLRGAGGRAFCAGADIAAFAAERATLAQAREYGAAMQAALSAIGECPHPTIALIEGICVGGGVEIAACCDIRICGSSSRFGVPISRLGLTMAYGELAPFVRLVGPAAAAEILLEGRIFAADHAARLGLVTRVVADERVAEEAYAAARAIGEGAPLVARWHKRFIRRLADPRPLTAEEQDEPFAAVETQDYREGVRAFLAKEPPRFTGR
jgi:enoyl-CoA hydratase